MKTKTFFNIVKTALVLTLASVSVNALAQELKPLKMCAFMLMGESGPEAQYFRDYQAAALNWGAKIEIKPYMSEKVVVEELKTGACDMANMSSISARSFNKFTGTLDAPAAIPTYDHLKMVLGILSKPSAEKYMRVGDYEIVGIQPAGAIFLFSNDRNVKSLADLAGKKMAVLDSMPELTKLVTDIGMTPVSSTLTNVFQKFNNKVVDIAGGPAIVYEIMELHKGLEPNGGILSEPIVQGTVQFVARHENLPEGFAQKSRAFFYQNFDESIKLIRTAEENVPKKWWLPLPEDQRDMYNTQTRSIRLSFREQNIYDSKMLTLLRKIRCKQQPTLAECTSKDAE